MSKLHVIFDRPSSTFHNDDTGDLTIRGATILKDGDTFTGSVLLTRLAMERHGTDAERVLATLPLTKFGFTVDGEWEEDPGVWTAYGIQALLRDGVPPPDCRVQQLILEMRQARDGERKGETVLCNETIDEIISLLQAA